MPPDRTPESDLVVCTERPDPIESLPVLPFGHCLHTWCHQRLHCHGRGVSAALGIIAFSPAAVRFPCVPECLLHLVAQSRSTSSGKASMAFAA